MNRISIYCIFFCLFKIWFIIRITTTSHTITKWNRHKNRTKHNKQYHINWIFEFTFHIFTFTKKLRISPILCHNYITSNYTYQFFENRYWETFKYLPTPSVQGGERYITYYSCFSLPSLKAWRFLSRPFPACAWGYLRSLHSQKRLAHLREHRLL